MKKKNSNPYTFMVVAIPIVALLAFNGYNNSKVDPVEEAIAERDAQLTAAAERDFVDDSASYSESDYVPDVTSDSSLDMISSNSDYQDMLDFYYHKFFSLMSPMSDNQIMETTDRSQRLEEISNTISKLDESSDELNAYFEEFDKYRTIPPMGTRIMDLFYNAQFAINDYKIAMQHLYNGIVNDDSNDIERSSKYLDKTNEELQAFHKTYQEESNK